MSKEGLSVWELTMMALGTVIGGSFFLGSAIAIESAGPAVIISFVLGGGLVYIVLNALSEMTVAKPATGSFQFYAEMVFGPGAGFVTGWTYWTGLILAMSSEATAVSLLMQPWLPGRSLPAIAVIVVLVITLLNLIGAKVLSRLESSLASVKLAALVGFIGLAFALIAGLLPGVAPVGAGVLKTENWLPHGIGGVAGSMLIVLFCYAGFEIIGLAAAEAKDPHRTVPRAINYTVAALVGLYIIVMAHVLPLVPTGALNEKASPLVAALTAGGLGVAGEVINLILISAIISTMLAATFGLGRMIRSLAASGHAPSFLNDTGEVPLRGILFSGLAMLLGVSLAYLLPNRIYIFLVSAGGFSLLFTYLMILLTHYRFRAANGCPPKGNCQLTGFPYTSWLGIISLVVVVLTMPLIPGQGAGLAAGLMLLVIFVAGYLIFRGRPYRRLATAKRLPKDFDKEGD